MSGKKEAAPLAGLLRPVKGEAQAPSVKQPGEVSVSPAEARRLLDMPLGKAAPKGKIALTWRVTPEMHERMRLLAFSERTSIQEIIDYVLEEFLDRYESKES